MSKGRGRRGRIPTLGFPTKEGVVGETLVSLQREAFGGTYGSLEKGASPKKPWFIQI
jgi:hypothetical protein